ncbi:MAG: oligosaccharide flippase family protein [Glaciimonas sp.]|nr:oligosaccharide flippase family protein [Glaciimonas sp.]
MISKQKLNMIFLAVNQGVNYLMPLLIFPFLVRVLGPEKFGLLSFSFATMQFMVLLTDYGFNYSATRSISIARQDKKLISEIYWRTIYSKAILCILSFIILFLLIELFDIFSNIRIILYINFLLIIGAVIYPVWLFQGLEKMGAITIFTVGSRVIVLVLFYFFVKNGSDLNRAVFLLAIPNFIAGIFALIFIYFYRIIFSVKFSFYEIRKSLMEGLQLFLSTLLTSMYTLMTPILLGIVGGPVSVGYLNVANTVKQAVCGIFSPVIQSYFPRVNALYIDDKALAVAIAKKILLYIVIILMIISVGLFFMAEFIINKAFGVKYIDAVPVLKVLAIAPIFIVANTILGLLMMVPRGDMKGYISSIATGAVASLLIVIPATYYLKETGGAITLLFAEIVVAAVMIFKIRRYKN